MGLFTKKSEKKEMEPQYYMSPTNIPAYNYKVYHMKLIEKILYFIIGFAAGAAVGYLFYGGIGKDEFGDPTALTRFLNVTISSLVGVIAGSAFIPIRRDQIIKKQKTKLNIQFRDFLEAFTTSLNAGKNVPDSFLAVQKDLQVQYDEGSYILKELEIIVSGLRNNVDVESLLKDMGQRSGIDDIASFANVFEICNRKGGNIKETIRSTHAILSDKMAILDEIETVVTSSKTEQNVMAVMPIALIGMIKMSSPDFAANFVTPTGILSTTIAVALFVASYFVGKAILNIKI